MGCVLRGPAYDYLPCGRRSCKVCLGRGTETPFLFNAMRSPVAVRNALKCSKTAEGSLGCVPRGPMCDYIPALWPMIAPDIIGQGIETPFYSF